MKYLCIVHAEEMFSDEMQPEFHYNLAKAVFTLEYDKILVMNSQLEESKYKTGLIPFVESLLNNGAEEIQWSWGYEKEMFYDEEEEETSDSKWVIESYGHEFTWIPEEVRSFTENDFVYLAGGYESECLEDFRCILVHLNVPYQKVATY